MIVKLTGAKKVLEVGVFTGFTTLAFAEALPDDGRVIACDISKEFASVGEPIWREAKQDVSTFACSPCPWPHFTV
jgi:predicted O-methyltransferase YrrM